MLKLTTDKHEASRGLSATAELLVLHIRVGRHRGPVPLKLLVIQALLQSLPNCEAKIYDLSECIQPIPRSVVFAIARTYFTIVMSTT